MYLYCGSQTTSPSHCLDNYLCVPNNSPYNFEWSQNGRINGTYYIEWTESADPNWGNNFLCANKM